MTGNSEPKIGGLLLAAGGSSRLGRPKQLVEFEGKTLIRRAAEMLVASVCEPVVVVLGAEIEGSSRELGSLHVSICVNSVWNIGISSTIKSGLRHLLTLAPNLDAVIIALCDQPFVTAEDIDRLAFEFQSGDSLIVASGYDGVAGVPTLFSKETFDGLFALEGDQGARYLIRRSGGVTTIPIASAAFDVDTPDDLPIDSSI